MVDSQSNHYSGIQNIYWTITATMYQKCTEQSGTKKVYQANHYSGIQTLYWTITTSTTIYQKCTEKSVYQIVYWYITGIQEMKLIIMETDIM